MSIEEAEAELEELNPDGLPYTTENLHYMHLDNERARKTLSEEEFPAKDYRNRVWALCVLSKAAAHPRKEVSA